MNYSKIATLGLRIFSLYFILFGLSDVIYVLYKIRTEAKFDSGYYGLMICFRFFVGLILIRLSVPLGRRMAKDLADTDSAL